MLYGFPCTPHRPWRFPGFELECWSLWSNQVLLSCLTPATFMVLGLYSCYTPFCSLPTTIIHICVKRLDISHFTIIFSFPNGIAPSQTIEQTSKVQFLASGSPYLCKVLMSSLTIQEEALHYFRPDWILVESSCLRETLRLRGQQYPWKIRA